MLKIRRSHDRLFFNMGISIPEKDGLYIETGPDGLDYIAVITMLHVTGLCAGNSPVTGEFPAQMASYAENVSIWWRHHDSLHFMWLKICLFHSIAFYLWLIIYLYDSIPLIASYYM